jgi:CheY-like chemotaxis protein
VLIVDDNDINLQVARSICELAGLVCELARDGLEAVQAMERQRFDLVLMDIQMPRMDGVQATRSIHELCLGVNEPPIVAVTANTDPDEVARYLAAGMCGVVAKPVAIEGLPTAVEQALFSSETRRSADVGKGRLCCPSKSAEAGVAVAAFPISGSDHQILELTLGETRRPGVFPSDSAPSRLPVFPLTLNAVALPITGG